MKFKFIYSHVQYTEQHCVDNEALYIFNIIGSSDVYIELHNCAWAFPLMWSGR